MHSEIPFDVLLEHLKIERNPAYSPIFQTFINYRPRTDESRPFGSNCTLTGVEYESGKTPYDVMLDVFDSQLDESRVEISLQKYLYSQDAVETLARSYLTLVKSFARNPLQPLDSAPLHSDQDLRGVAELGKGKSLTLVPFLDMP
jgi:non-ribosomal peptide synthetase component F